MLSHSIIGIVLNVKVMVNGIIVKKNEGGSNLLTLGEGWGCGL